MDKRFGVIPLFLIAVVFVWTGPLFWRHAEIEKTSMASSYENRELYERVYPLYHYISARLRSGHFPLWNPQQLCGTPICVDPRTGLFQPLNFPFLLFPTEQALAIQAVLCLILMGCGFAWFCRSIGLKAVPALAGGLIFSYSGAVTAAISYPSSASALAWSPFFLWSVHEYVRQRKLSYAVCGGILAALMAASGSYVLSAVLFIFGVVFALGTAYSGPSIHNRPSLFPGWLLMGSILLGVSAPHWLPALLWQVEGNGPARLINYIAVEGIAPRTFHAALFQLAAYRPGTLPRLGYMGIIPVLLILLSIFNWKSRRYVYLSWGTATLFAWFYFHMTQQQDTIPSRQAFLYPVIFSLSVLAASGMQRLLYRPSQGTATAVWFSFCTNILLSGFLFYFSRGQMRAYILIYLLLSCILFPASLRRWKRLAAVTGCGILIVIGIDLMIANVNAYPHPYQNAPACFAPLRQVVVSNPTGNTTERFMVSAGDMDLGFPQNTGMFFLSGKDSTALRFTGGFALPMTAGQRQWWNLLTGTSETENLEKAVRNDCKSLRLLNFMNFHGLFYRPGGRLAPPFSSQSGLDLQLVNTIGDTQIYTNNKALPRVYWVPESKEGYGPAAAAEKLVTPDFNPNRQCLVEKLPESARNLLSGKRDSASHFSRENAHCSIEELSPEKIVLHVDTPLAGIVVLADTYAPGWYAHIRGETVPVLRVNGIFMGTAVPAGSFDILYTYHPIPFYAGAGIALFTLMALLCSGLFILFRPLSRPGSGPPAQDIP